MSKIQHLVSNIYYLASQLNTEIARRKGGRDNVWDEGMKNSKPEVRYDINPSATKN